ncbi:MAG: hypothetical protein HQM12_11885 [SAR324 cluster bacterium]|nr:hypothetical protein [SAR324 cluster bacterium]
MIQGLQQTIKHPPEVGAFSFSLASGRRHIEFLVVALQGTQKTHFPSAYSGSWNFIEAFCGFLALELFHAFASDLHGSWP